jgi:hypothetical protein
MSKSGTREQSPRLLLRIVTETVAASRPELSSRDLQPSHKVIGDGGAEPPTVFRETPVSRVIALTGSPSASPWGRGPGRSSGPDRHLLIAAAESKAVAVAAPVEEGPVSPVLPGIGASPRHGAARSGCGFFARSGSATSARCTPRSLRGRACMPLARGWLLRTVSRPG